MGNKKTPTSYKLDQNRGKTGIRKQFHIFLFLLGSFFTAWSRQSEVRCKGACNRFSKYSDRLNKQISVWFSAFCAVLAQIQQGLLDSILSALPGKLVTSL